MLAVRNQKEQHDWRPHMSGRNISVFGIYPTHESADAAVATLRAKGFRNTDVSVLFPQNPGSKEFGHEKGTKSAEGAVAGGGTGAVVGGALGWLAGIGMLAIPGVGPFIAAGPIVASLAGMGAGGAIGGMTGGLIGLGIPEYQAKRYEGRMRKGGILLSVHADDRDWASKGEQILEQTGAEDISKTGETKGDFGNTDRPTVRAEHVEQVEVIKH
jgi:ActD protein